MALSKIFSMVVWEKALPRVNGKPLSKGTSRGSLGINLGNTEKHVGYNDRIPY